MKTSKGVIYYDGCLEELFTLKWYQEVLIGWKKKQGEMGGCLELLNQIGRAHV